jgi:hypothetical protein
LMVTKTPTTRVDAAMSRLRDRAKSNIPIDVRVDPVSFKATAINATVDRDHVVHLHHADGRPVAASELQVGKEYTFDATGLLLEK